MRSSGFLTATVPEAHGGLGLSSIHDLTVGLAFLGQADGSVSISANMHLVFPLLASWLQDVLRQRGESEWAERLERALAQLATGCIVMGNVTEAGTDIAHPLTEATQTPGGWSLRGRKIFGTLSPVAEWFVVSCRVRRLNGTFAGAYALVPRGCKGQRILDNWDSLGMRASGSQDIEYDDCFVPDHRLLSLDRDWGIDDGTSQALDIIGNVGLLGTYLGIAEAAQRYAFAAVGARDGQPDQGDGTVLHLIAEIEVAIAAMRAVIERTTCLVDKLILRVPAEGVEGNLAFELGTQFQCAKLLVNESAIGVVNRALTVTGGAAYMSSHPLARLYRDVRAGPFMQPHSPKEAYGFIARASLGRTPVTEP